MKCMVIDGNSIINRAYYGIRPLTNREGLYTHAVFGFLTTLLRLKEEERPDALCVTFDLHAPTFRHKADEAYKATRKPMPEELRMQVPVLKEVLDTLNIPRYEMEGWEADDLIGTISRKCEAAGWDCVVVTGDKDSLQLITDHTKVKLVSTRMGQTTTKDMTPETFREQYGFEPIHMIDLKALMGDTSDNIPGVPGIGEKTAMDLIQKYGSVDVIYEKLPDIDAKPAAIKKLTAGEEAARHSYWLATIVTDAPLSFDPAENRVQEPTPAAYPLFLKLEFSKLIEKMGLRPEETAPADAAPDVTVTAERITEESRAREVLELFRRADHVTVLALPDLSGVIADCDTGADTALSAEFFFERYTGDWNALLNALFAADIKKVSHNVKNLMRTLLENGLNADYVANVGEKCIEAAYPMTIGHRLAMMPVTVMDQPIRVAVAQRQLLEKFAQQGDCVIVGRCADVILKDYHPLNLFVYADMDAKVERCMKRAPEGEHLTRSEMEKAIRRIDKERAQNHLMYADTKWGSKESYHLCVNTTHREIKQLVPALAQFCKDWFAAE